MKDLINGVAALELLDGAVKRKGADHKYVKPERPAWVIDEMRATAIDMGLDLTEPDWTEEIGHWWDNADCLYFHGQGQPGCIVGNVLHSEFEINAGEIEEGTRAGHAISETLADRDLSPLAEDIFDHAQHEQDMGYTWGAAVEAARAKFEKEAWDEAADPDAYYNND